MGYIKTSNKIIVLFIYLCLKEKKMNYIYQVSHFCNSRYAVAYLEFPINLIGFLCYIHHFCMITCVILLLTFEWKKPQVSVWPLEQKQSMFVHHFFHHTHVLSVCFLVAFWFCEKKFATNCEKLLISVVNFPIITLMQNANILKCFWSVHICD